MGSDVTIGMRRGHLTVLRELPHIKGQHHKFECQCDCGKTAILRGPHFYHSRSYCSRECPLQVPDLIGRKFGRWSVLKMADRQTIGGRKRRTWECVCDCGRRKAISGSMLLDGESQSCGCALIEKLSKRRTPEQFLADKRAASRKSARKNAARIKAAKIRYLAKLSKATPDWLTREHWALMNAFYERARRLTDQTGIRHEVDHIVPINGKTVSGLHVPWNLQILTQSANVAKSNIYAELSGD